ncbi:MAG: hypothetical protein K0Q48_3400, partial [Bacillota bacterium]|nr:hypothetical protein [Bacillota bacterium]
EIFLMAVLDKMTSASASGCRTILEGSLSEPFVGAIYGQET